MRGEGKAEQAQRRSADGLHAEFERLAERALRILISNDPVQASWLGIHGKHDALLPDLSAEAEKQSLAEIRTLLRDFERIDPARLGPIQRVELPLARGYLTAHIALAECRPRGRLMPQAYLEDCVYGTYILLLRPYAPVEERARSLLGRLRAIPAFLAEAERNLIEPPALFTEAAILSAHGAEEFFGCALAGFVEGLPDAPLRQQCRRAAAEVHTAVQRYSEFLHSNLMPRSGGDFRIGKPIFNQLLRHQHGIPFDADDLVLLGERIYHETLREARATAARIGPGRNWSRLLQELNEDHPANSELLQAYKAAVQKSRRFIQEKGLVGIPKGESLEVVPTPVFARQYYPFAGYVAPAPFEKSLGGTFWVTQANPSDPPERQASVLEGHSRSGIPVLALHEGYPGHHLQLSLANRLGRKLRILFATPVFSEGWALYCEELMGREGFFADERVRLLQLRNQLWRACRVIVDVRLHTGEMTFSEAAGFLVRKAKLERVSAMAEVRRYCTHPTQPMSYVVGKLLITELLEDWRAARSENQDLRAFHDDLLSHGTLPIELVRQEMGIPRRRSERELLAALGRTPHPQDSSKRRPARRAAKTARRPA